MEEEMVSTFDIFSTHRNLFKTITENVFKYVTKSR